MKHFIQYTAILGAILTVLGFGTAGAARMNGARWSQMHLDRQNITMPWMGHHKSVHTYDIPFGAETGTWAGKGIKTFPAARKLSISLEYGNLTMEYGDIEEIQVDCGEDSVFGEIVWAYTEDGEMELVIYGKRNTDRKPEISVIIPRNHVFQELEMEIAAGRSTALDLQAQHLDLELAAGEIILENMRSSSLSIDCAAGNISCSGQALGDIDVDCAAGNVALFLEHDEEDFNYELECAGGSIQIGRDTFSGLAFSREYDHHAGRTMELQTVTGNIQVEFSSDVLRTDGEASRCEQKAE